ncbi:polysaccharide pyruvyl transferase [Qipengyuania citrea LAMA 915]|uniref:Polysaccharide pyruvyl transferase n=1 Tax=Qipengyuania citrea LAMA 915 TaxID=1306953 RepID=A0A0L1KHH9_9SPHN|nr:polysaccharide pyruvyl transferase family protein [Qipengyuania citrea]KNH03428.1 polysaccharide pyruvyl transferase [Qipengyuania citrea LAMA 915]
MENLRHLKIALPWHTFGHDNLGIDALSRANAAIIESAAFSKGISVEFLTLGSRRKSNAIPPSSTIKIGPSPSLNQLARGNFAIFRELRSCDLAFDIAEGDSFTDIYGRRRFFLHCLTKLASILMSQPIVLSPQTIGPFDRVTHRGMAKFILNRLTSVYTRDFLSTEFLSDLRISSNKDEFIDVAFRLPFTPRPKDKDLIRVGVNVSGLLYNGGYTGGNELNLSLDYRAFTKALIETLQNRPGIEVNLFSHVAGGGGRDDDGPAVLELAKCYPKTKAIPVFETSIEAKSWVSGLDFVVGGRMHACIAAFSSGVPVVPVAYSRKFNGLFGTLNYPYFVDGKEATSQQALVQTMAWFDNRKSLKDGIEASSSIVDERLNRYEAAIGELLYYLAVPREKS